MRNKQFRFGDLCSLQQGFAFKSDSFKNTGLPVIKIKNIKPVKISLHQLDYVSKDFKETHKKYIPSKGDLLISMSGNRMNGTKETWVGKVTFFDKEDLFFVNQRIGILRNLQPDLVDFKFLAYLFSTDSWQLRLVQIATSSGGQANLSSDQILNEIIELPDIRIQKIIAKILGTLDDKIDLNHRQNLTLENIAKSIFKSWFIDFEPTQLKVKQCPTKLLSEVSDLFPDEFIDSELGKIPRGWSVKTLQDSDLEIESGKRPKGGIDKDLNVGIPSVGAESIDTPGIFDFSKVKYVQENFAMSAKKGWVKNYDVALYKDGAFVSKVSLYGDGFPFFKFMVNEHVFLLRSIKLGQFYLYRLIFSDLIKNQLISMGTSKAAQPGLNQEEVASCTFICPSQNLLDCFNKIIKPLVEKQFLLGRESQILRNIRDAFLPKLISGEMQIPDAEKFLEEAGI